MSTRRPIPLIEVAHRMFDTPLAIHPTKYEIILRAIGPRIGMFGDSLVESTGNKLNLSGELTVQDSEQLRGLLASDEDYNSNSSPNRQSKKPYEVTEDGCAIIKVCGTLVKKSSWMNSLSGMTSYQSIQDQIAECVANRDIRSILLNCNSPGGETHGLFDLVDFIYSCRGTKPIYACANDAALSAAYAIASCADRLYVTRTGAVGSIGVFCGHVDQSGADKQAGLKFSYIHAGEKKVDGNPHEPLSKSARADAQAEVDREYGMFVALVSRNRKADKEEVINTQAGVYFADLSIPLLADEVGTLDEAYAAVVEKSGTAVSVGTGTYPADRVSGKTETGKLESSSGEADMKVGATHISPEVKAQVEAMSPEAAKTFLSSLVGTETPDEIVSKMASAELLSLVSAKAAGAKAEGTAEVQVPEVNAADKKPATDPADDNDEDDNDEDDKGAKGKGGKMPKQADDGCDPADKPDDMESKKGKGPSTMPTPTATSTAAPLMTLAEAAQINNICEMAGLPSKFATSIIEADGMTLTAALTKIQDERVKRAKDGAGSEDISSLAAPATGSALTNLLQSVKQQAKQSTVTLEPYQTKGVHRDIVRDRKMAVAAQEVLEANPDAYAAMIAEQQEASLTSARAATYLGKVQGQLGGGTMIMPQNSGLPTS